MRILLSVKIFISLAVLSLLYFGLVPQVSILSLLKLLAVSAAVSIVGAVFYPELRGIKIGDIVSVINTPSSLLLAKTGVALEAGRKSNRIKIRLNNGGEALGVIRSYTGIISPPKVEIIYEEKIHE